MSKRKIRSLGKFGSLVLILGLPMSVWAQSDEPVVAVIDSGVNPALVNSGAVNQVGGFNFLGNNGDTSDASGNSHGSTSSLIINREAPGIPQVINKVSSSSGTSAAATNAAVQSAAADPNVRVLVISDGTVSVPIPAIADASAAGKLVSIRAGNEAAANPAAAAVAASTMPGVVVVTGTNSGGGFLLSTNACGVAATRCVGVRGSNDFNGITGSSFAAARLGGIAAEVMRAAPFLSAEEVAQVIFITAIDTGDPRIGHGFVPNAEHVINTPAGATFIADADSGGGGGGVAAIALVAGVAGVGAVLLNKDEELETTLVLDSFGRPFSVDLTELVEIDDKRKSIASFFDALEQRYDSQSFLIDGRHTLDIAYVTYDRSFVDTAKYFAFEDDPIFQDEKLHMVFNLQGHYENGFHYQFSRNRDPSMNFGLLDWADNEVPNASGHSSFISGQSFAIPLLGFSATADSLSLGFEGDHGFDMKFGLVNTDENRRHGRESVAAVFEGSYRFSDRGAISFQLGRLKENGSLFGGASDGSLSVDNTDTFAVSLSGSMRLSDSTFLVGNYGIAYSDVKEAEVGLFNNFSSLRSNWFGVGLISNEIFSKGDQMGFAFSQPLRIIDGEVDLEVPYARDFEGNIYENVDRISLEAPGTEYTLESYYMYPLNRRSALGAYLMLRHEPNHVADSGLDVTILGSYRLKF